MANSNIVLTSATRSSLLTLQNTSDLQSRVQERLATGRKVNSALDNPTNFFTAAGLNRRANDLSSLLDGMSNGIKTLEAADNAMKSITRTVETMQANIRSARQDKSFKGVSYTMTPAASGNLSFSGGRHFCLGAALARAEGEVGLRTFFERFPDARLAGSGSRRDTRVLRGWSSLPVALGTARAMSSRP